MKAFDEAYTKVIQDYAHDIILYIAKYPQHETPMIMVAMNDIIRGLLESPSVLTDQQKRLYHAMAEYNEKYFDADISINYESEGK